MTPGGQTPAHFWQRALRRGRMGSRRCRRRRGRADVNAPDGSFQSSTWCLIGLASCINSTSSCASAVWRWGPTPARGAGHCGPGWVGGRRVSKRANRKQHVCGSFGHVHAIPSRALLQRLGTSFVCLQKVVQICPGMHRQSVMGEHGGNHAGREGKCFQMVS